MFFYSGSLARSVFLPSNPSFLHELQAFAGTALNEQAQFLVELRCVGLKCSTFPNTEISASALPYDFPSLVGYC